MMQAPDFVVQYSRFDLWLRGKRLAAAVLLSIYLSIAYWAWGGLAPFGNYYSCLLILMLYPLSIMCIEAAGQSDILTGALVTLFRTPLLLAPYLLWKAGGWNYFTVSAMVPVIYLMSYWLYNTIYNTAFRLSEPEAHWQMVKRVQQQDDQLKAKGQAPAKAGCSTATPETQPVMFQAEEAKICFDDVVGMAELKGRLKEAAVQIVEDSGDGRNGILLSGDPGNGKTMFAEALAGELQLPIMKVSFGDVASKWINQTTEQVARLFADAKAQAPCLLFIDEIDSLARDRSKASSSDSETVGTTNTILTELVNIRKSGVVVVAATNHLEVIDSAVIREGRFDFKVEVVCPDHEARVAILCAAISKGMRGIHNKNVRVNRAAGAAEIPVDMKVLHVVAKRWDGFSAARIDAIGKELVSMLKGKEQKELTFELAMEALRITQGRSGKLPADARTLDQLSQPEAVQGPLLGIATRMQQIVEIEELGGTVPAGILFKGPAGTGKTTAAMALAKSAGWAFLTVSGMDLLKQPERIEKIFKEAANLRPCVLFIDEADDVLADRTYSHNASITNKFLTEMDGARGKSSDVLIVAATNFPEKMDPAALRGGRFTEKVEFLLADECQVGTVISQWRANLKLPVAGNVTDRALSEALVGLSVANIEAVLQQVVNIVINRKVAGGSPVILLEDVAAAIDMVL